MRVLEGQQLQQLVQVDGLEEELKRLQLELEDGLIHLLQDQVVVKEGLQQEREVVLERN
jgi:hypothetical protein